MDGLLKAIESALNHARHHIVVRLPYAMGGMVETLHDGAQVKKWTTPRRASRSRPWWTESSTADSGNISSGSAEDWTSI